MNSDSEEPRTKKRLRWAFGQYLIPADSADSDFEEISPEEGFKGKGKMANRSGKDPRVGGQNIPGRTAARNNNSVSKEQTPRDSYLSDDATGSPWMPDPNSPLFGRTFGSQAKGKSMKPEAESTRNAKSVPPTVRKDNLGVEDVNAQTTSSSAPSSPGVTTRETGSSAIDTPVAAGVAVPSTPNEAQDGDSHQSPTMDGVPVLSPVVSMKGDLLGPMPCSANGDIYDVPDDTAVESKKSLVHSLPSSSLYLQFSMRADDKLQKRKRHYDPVYPNKLQRSKCDNDVTTSTLGNPPDTLPSAGETIVEHISLPESTGDQGDSLPPFSEAPVDVTESSWPRFGLHLGGDQPVDPTCGIAAKPHDYL
jgi:hypothetical protein